MTETQQAGERFLRWRARLLPLTAIALIVGNAVLSGSAPRSVQDVLSVLAVVVSGFTLVMTGGLLPGRLRRLAEDESTAQHRAMALRVGYIAAVACALGQYVAALFVPLSAHQALQIVLMTAIAAPMISFGAQEAQALRDAG